MSKSDKKSEGSEAHDTKADVRHRYKVTELADFTRREKKADGTDRLMPRVAVLAPVGGGKQVRAYVPGNLEEPLEVGCVVQCRPHDKTGLTGDGPPVKFRVTNVLESRGLQNGFGEVLNAMQNAKAGSGADAPATADSAQREGAART